LRPTPNLEDQVPVCMSSGDWVAQLYLQVPVYGGGILTRLHKGHETVYIRKVKKFKLSLCLTNYALRHEDLWGSGCINPYFLDLGTSWK
jgi:hypothetical protein